VPATEEDRQPWGDITESGWTYFGSILFTVILFALFHLKYERKVIRRPKNLKKEKNEKVLQTYLLAQEKAAHTVLPQGEQEVDQFLKQCAQRKKHPVIFKIEFSSAVEGAEPPNAEVSSVACRPSNLAKNRSVDVIPFDSSRVILDQAKEGGIGEKEREAEGEGEVNEKTVNGRIDEDGGYINASYVGGLLEGWDYIVTQGTMDSTLVDFWAMVWQEKVPVIVMLTKTFDYIRVMCAQYWPASLHREEEYSYPDNGDGFWVTVKEELHYASYIHRRMLLRRGTEQRQVDHFQYTEWPCYSSPSSGALLHFRSRVAASWASSLQEQDGSGTQSIGRCLVHCHDGGGRSGVFLAVDANIRLAKERGRVEICSYLSRIRRARPGLVANQEQYRLVYSLVEEALVCGDNSRSLAQLKSSASQDLTEEFLLVNKVRPGLTQGDCAGGHRLDNRGKSRSVVLLPPDAHRPYITSFQGNDCTDYINAVFVDGHTQANDLIVTEWPLGSTLQNFWSMVYDHEVSTVVVLDSPRLGTKYPAFWPPEMEKPKKYGPVFSVEKVEGGKEGAANNGFSSYRLHLCKKEVAPHRKTQSLYVDDKQVSSLTNLVVGVTAPVKRCQIFQLHSWQGATLPASLARLLQAARSHRDSANPESPVVVVSTNGAERAGVYCAVSHSWDQLLRQGQADVVHAVHCVRLSRPQLVPTLQEYSLIYRVLAASLPETVEIQ